MTNDENTAVALAQAAYQRAIREINTTTERRQELARIGLLGLLACELKIDTDEM